MLRSWLCRLGNLFDRERRERGLAEEIESHIKLHIDHNLRCGMSPEEARRAALLKLGGVEATKEIYRDQLGIPVVEHFIRDVRYAVFTAVKNKSFTAVVVLTLGLGLGVTILVFSVVDALFLRALPYADAGRLAVIQKPAQSGGDKGLLSFLELQDLKARGIFEGVAGCEYSAWPGVLTSGDRVELTSVVGVTEDFFKVLGVQPLVGSTPDSGEQGGIVLSHTLWKRLFGGRPEAVGYQVRLGGFDRTVLGVMPAGFQLFRSERPEIFTPATALRHPDTETLECIARLRSDLELPTAMRELASISGRGEKAGSRGVRYEATDLRSHLFGDYRAGMLMLSGAALFFLLIACANVANLLLTRMTMRAQELRIRIALGASRLRVTAQLLTENLVSAIAGSGVGLLLVFGSIRLLERLRMGGFRTLPPFRIDGPVLVFTALLCLLVPLICALGPVLRLTRQAGAQLKEGAPTLTPTHWRAGRAIVICGMASSFMLLVGAGLLAASFIKLARVDPGFQAANVMFLEFDDNQLFYQDILRRQAFYDELVHRVQALPEVAAAGQTDQVPLSDDVWNIPLPATLASPPGSTSGRTSVFLRTVDSGFFGTLRIPLRNGRLIEAGDKRGRTPVAVINEGFARQVWGATGNPVGQRLKLLGMDLTIVGVAGDVRESGLRNKPTDQILYVSTGQFMKGNRVLAVRARNGTPEPLVARLKELARSLEPGAPAIRVRNMSRIVADSIAAERFSALLMTALSALALALASVGVYAVAAFSVSQRTREFGVRLALGARQGEIMSLLLREEAWLVAAAVGLGTFGGGALTRLLASQLYEVEANNPLFFVASALCLAVFATVACYLPARRASRADPIAVLRCE